MTFDRSRLPDPSQFYESEGLKLTGPKSSKWRTTQCHFHGGSDSMRVNVANGAFKCMNCGEGGGDVVTYAIKRYELDFISAAKLLRAWIYDSNKVRAQQKPTTLSPRDALQVLNREATLTAVAAGNIANGTALTETDRARLKVCANRIIRIAEEFKS